MGSELVVAMGNESPSMSSGHKDTTVVCLHHCKTFTHTHTQKMQMWLTKKKKKKKVYEIKLRVSFFPERTVGG